jgi:sigma-E factor negative regulatory protein RseA
MEDKISALMDGELDAEDATNIVAQFGKTDEFRDEWTIYHMISDVMGQPGQTAPMPADISRRVSSRLATEPAVNASPVAAPRPAGSRHRMKAYAIAASMTAAAVVGWMNLQVTEQPAQVIADNSPAVPAQSQAQVATTALPPIPVTSVSASAPIHIDDYLLAHRAFSPGTAMPGAVPYVRAVAESREISAR